MDTNIIDIRCLLNNKNICFSKSDKQNILGEIYNENLKDLKKFGYWVFAAEAFNSQPYETVDYKCPVVLVVGSGGFGISRLVKEKCDFTVSIPMLGNVNSLNVSCAAAVILNEVAKQKYIKNK